MKIFRCLLLATIIFGIAPVAVAQNYTISGVVCDSITGEAMVGVNIIADNSNRGTSTNGKGEYSISLSSGEHTLSVSFVGYTTITKSVIVNQNKTIDFSLISNTAIEEVVISSVRADNNVTNISMGVEQMSMVEIRKLPALMGEVDILKVIALMPGVQNTSEGSSGFSVRGGSPDQNLILLDNTPVYNASHLMGFFSVFNNDAIEGLELYKGDLPLRYGGRISSLLDVKTRSEIPERYLEGTGGVGVISSRIMLEGAITKDINWMVAGRRSYADIFLAFSPNEALQQTKIYFYDLNGKVTWRIGGRNILELTAYHGNDTFGADVGQFDYGNSMAAMTWKYFITDKIELNTSANYTNYGYYIGGEVAQMGVTWDADIKDYSFRLDTDHRIGDTWKLTYGATTTYHIINPGTIITTQPDEFGAIGDILPPQIIPEVDAWESAVYLSSEHNIFDWWSVRYGVRGVLFDNGTKNFFAPEPRIGAVFMLSKSSSIKANYSFNSQFIQVANNSTSGSPMDVWFPASNHIEPQMAHTAALGYFQNFEDNNWELSVEGYYKDLQNVIDFKDNAKLFGNPDLIDEVLVGDGKAYGIELQLKRNVGKVNGFINYTLSRSERTIAGINGGNTYLAPHDKTHSLNLMLNWEITPQVILSLTWIYTTGIPTTLPIGAFKVGDAYFPIYSDRNEYRYPDYHRLDVGIEWTPKQDKARRWKSSWNFSIYNLYNQKNPWMIGFATNQETQMTFAEMTYLFGIVPSITYNFRF